MTKKLIEMSRGKPRMTQLLHFERQLWPQPAKSWTPYWYLAGRLAFRDKNGVHRWEQEPPESYYKDLPESRGIYNLRVEWDDNFGWLLKFSMGHGAAKVLWDQAIKPVNPGCPAPHVF